MRVAGKKESTDHVLKQHPSETSELITINAQSHWRPHAATSCTVKAQSCQMISSPLFAFKWKHIWCYGQNKMRVFHINEEWVSTVGETSTDVCMHRIARKSEKRHRPEWLKPQPHTDITVLHGSSSSQTNGIVQEYIQRTQAKENRIQLVRSDH